MWYLFINEMRTVATRSLSDIKSTKSLKIYGER